MGGFFSSAEDEKECAEEQRRRMRTKEEDEKDREKLAHRLEGLDLQTRKGFALDAFLRASEEARHHSIMQCHIRGDASDALASSKAACSAALEIYQAAVDDYKTYLASSESDSSPTASAKRLALHDAAAAAAACYIPTHISYANCSYEGYSTFYTEQFDVSIRKHILLDLKRNDYGEPDKSLLNSPTLIAAIETAKKQVHTAWEIYYSRGIAAVETTPPLNCITSYIGCMGRFVKSCLEPFQEHLNRIGKSFADAVVDFMRPMKGPNYKRIFGLA